MSSARATQLIEAGLWLRLTGDIEGARALFEKALSVDPGNARATQLLGDERIGAGPVVRPKPPATGATSGPAALPSTMIFGGGPPPEPTRPTPVPAAAAGKSSMLFGGTPASPSVSRPTPIPAGQTLLYPGFAQPPPVERPTTVPPLPAAPRPPGSMSGSPTAIAPVSMPGRASSAGAPSGHPTPPPVAPVSMPGRASSAGALGGHPTPPPIAPVSMPGRAPSAGALGGHPTPPPVAPVSMPGGASLSGGSGTPAPVASGRSSSAVTSTGRATPPPSVPARSSFGAGASDFPGGPTTVPSVEARRPTHSPSVDLLSAWDEAVPGDAAPSIELSSARTGPDALDLLASAAPAPPATASQPSSKKELIARETAALLAGVKDLIELDDHTGALDLLEKATELSPNHPDLARLRERSEQILISRYESKLGTLAAAPRVVLSQDEVIWLNLDHRAGFVLAQIDGTVSFEDLFAVCGMSRIDTARILAQLVDEGVIAAAGNAPRGHR